MFNTNFADDNRLHYSRLTSILSSIWEKGRLLKRHLSYFYQVYSDEDTWLQFARLTQIFRALAPYSREAVSRNSDDGVPVMRPLFLDFESDPGARGDEVQYEYLFGDDLLVAPVVAEGAVEAEVYLPGPQGWVWLWDADEAVLQGPMAVAVEAPLGQTPVFYKAGSQWTDLFRQIADAYALS